MIVSLSIFSKRMLQGLVEGIIEPYHKVFVEDQQEDSHSEGGLAVSVILAPTETQEYPNNTTEVQMEEIFAWFSCRNTRYAT